MINERYLIKNKIGKGRSQVFLCSDVEFPDIDLAIKILPIDSDEFETKIFRNEFFTLRKLDHPNVIKANEIGVVVKLDNEENIRVGSKFFLMEYFQGDVLANHIKSFNENSLFEVIKQLCSVLYYLHQSNYIYYDLKPENILVSEIDGKHLIKLIDLGFAQNIFQNTEEVVRGTAEYIAPEILRKEPHDHRADLYSLGIMLYKIVYERFPFETGNELEIYKSHLEKEFEFPGTKFPDILINSIRKLLSKNPDERFQNTLELLDALNIPISDDISKDWIPAKIFSDRADILTILKTYFEDDSSNEVFTIKGFEGSGKTSLVDEVYYRHENVILVKNNKTKAGFDFIKLILKQIIFNQFIFEKLSSEIKDKVYGIFNSPPQDLVSELKIIFTAVSMQNSFVLILDAFNFYDELAVEVFKNIIPILQVNKIKVVLTENSDFNYLSNFIFNLREINLIPFTDIHLDEFITKSFYKNFPREDLKKLILQHADLLPGSIEGFLRDITLLKIVKFSSSGVTINTGDDELSVLKGSQEEIYKLRFHNLSAEEIAIIKLISSFDVTLDLPSISRLTNLPIDVSSTIISGLQNKNIIQQYNRSAGIVFTSDGIKKFAYSQIDNHSSYHLEIAKKLTEKFTSFNKIEIARHFELAGEHYKSYELYKYEIEESERLSTFAYQKNILLHLLQLKLKDKDLVDIRFRLINVHHKLGENKQALMLIEELLTETKDDDLRVEILILKGSCLIGLGENETGKKLLESLMPKIKDESRKQTILAEIASAELDLNHYDDVKRICTKLINEPDTQDKVKAKCYNLLGLVELYNSKYNEALNNVEIAKEIYYRLEDLNFTAQMETNIGVINYSMGNYKDAEKVWKNSLDSHLKIGNLEQEGKLLFNLGYLNYENLILIRTVELYKRAMSIFLSLGNIYGYGQSLTNLGEVYLLTCDYEKSYITLLQAIDIFSQLGNFREKFEAQYILMKLYFVIGETEHFRGLKHIYIDESWEINFSDRNKTQFKFLLQLEKAYEGFANTDIQKVNSLLDDFLKQNDKIHYFATTILIVKNLIASNKAEEAAEVLSSNRIKDMIKDNILFFAEREYMLGKIACINSNINLKPPIDYFISAFSVMEDFTLTELTWKILFEMGSYYYQRGNYGKAKENLHYAKEIINYFAENIKDAHLHEAYLKERERSGALEIMTKLGI